MNTDVRRHYVRLLLPVFPSLSYLLFGRSSGFESSLESEMFIPLEGGFDSVKKQKRYFQPIFQCILVKLPTLSYDI